MKTRGMKTRGWDQWSMVRVALMCAAGLLVLVGCASAASGTDAAGGSGSPTAATTVPASTSTAASATPPRLGGTIADFTARYGQPNDHSTPSTGSYHYARIAGENTDGVIVQSAIAEGDAYAQLVELIVLAAPSGQPWSVSTAQTICGALDPADTTGMHSQPVVSAQGQLEGVDVVAHSASLAAALPASAFLDANQNAAPAGSFDTFYLYRTLGDASSGIDSCQLVVGTTQTQG